MVMAGRVTILQLNPGREAGLALSVADDDQRAKDVVIRLIKEIGFDGVDLGVAWFLLLE